MHAWPRGTSQCRIQSSDVQNVYSSVDLDERISHRVFLFRFADLFSIDVCFSPLGLFSSCIVSLPSPSLSLFSSAISSGVSGHASLKPALRNPLPSPTPTMTSHSLIGTDMFVKLGWSIHHLTCYDRPLFFTMRSCEIACMWASLNCSLSFVWFV